MTPKKTPPTPLILPRLNFSLAQPSDIKALHVSLHILVRPLPEIIRHQANIVRIDLQQRPIIRIPPRPIRIPAGRRVRIQIVHERIIVRPRRRARIVGEEAVEDIQDVAGVEGAQQRDVVVVAGRVRPRRRARVGRVGVRQEAPMRRGEGQVADDGGQTLVLRVELVVEAGVEGRALGRVVRVLGQEAGDLGGALVVEEDGREVLGELGLCGDVPLHKGEDGAFVLLVADDEGHGRVFARLHEDVRGYHECGSVWARQVGERDGFVAEDARDGVDGVQVLLVGQGTQACERVARGRAAGGLDDLVVHGLALGAVNSVCRNYTTTVHDGSPEEGLVLVRVVPVVESKLVEDRYRTGALSPDCNLGRITSESCNVVCGPLQPKPLVQQA